MRSVAALHPGRVWQGAGELVGLLCLLLILLIICLGDGGMCSVAQGAVVPDASPCERVAALGEVV